MEVMTLLFTSLSELIFVKTGVAFTINHNFRGFFGSVTVV